jgi:holin-like protein
MRLHALHIAGRRHLRTSRPLQIGLVMGFWLLGEAVARATGWPIPGGIFGMALVLILLGAGGLDQRSLRRGADWFLAEMLLFFVPAVLAVLNYPALIGWAGLKILAIILVSTALVMVVTGLVVEWGLKIGGGSGDGLD